MQYSGPKQKPINRTVGEVVKKTLPLDMMLFVLFKMTMACLSKQMTLRLLVHHATSAELLLFSLIQWQVIVLKQRQHPLVI